MSKAILIMDMPKSCNECDVICTKYYSALQNGNLEVLTKPSDCPLKEVPEYKKSILRQEEFGEGFDIGYNACIDEILKGSEESE